VQAVRARRQGDAAERRLAVVGPAGREDAGEGAAQVSGIAGEPGAVDRRRAREIRRVEADEGVAPAAKDRRPDPFGSAPTQSTSARAGTAIAPVVATLAATRIVL